MTTTEVSKGAAPAPFTVLNVVLDSGERLPCLVESATWHPVRVATRWAVRYRRYRVQSSTLANNLRVLARVYRWAQGTAGYDLDNHLTQGQTLRNREIESLVSTLRATTDGHALDTGAFDQHLAVIEDFVKWSLDSENRGARKPPKKQRKPFKIRRIGLCAAELRLLCYGLYFIMQSMAVVLLRIQCRKQQLEFHSDRLLGGYFRKRKNCYYR